MPKYHATLQSQTDEHKRFATGTYPSKDAFRKHLEAQEAEYVAFRIDEQETHDRYPGTLGASFASPAEALAHVEEHTTYHPEDTHLVNGRFVRAGKVTSSNKLLRAWRHIHLQEQPYKVTSIGQVDEEGPRAAVTAGQYGVPIKNFLAGANLWDWDTDTIKLALTTSSYTVDIDTHDFFNDVTNELSTAGNYTAGGFTLTTAAPTYDTATDQIRCDATDVSQASATFTARRAVIYKSTGTSSTSPLISFIDFGADVSPSAGTFAITFDVTGVFIIDVT